MIFKVKSTELGHFSTPPLPVFIRSDDKQMCTLRKKYSLQKKGLVVVTNSVKVFKDKSVFAVVRLRSIESLNKFNYQRQFSVHKEHKFSLCSILKRGF